MGLVGADVAQLRDLAGVMRRNADILERDIVGVIVASLRVSPWAGTDAEHFKQIWTFQSARQIWSAAMRLREAADVLDRNADDQDKASASVSGAIRGRIPAADGGRGLGKKTATNPEGFTEPRGGAYGLDRDALDLSFAAYDHTVGPTHDNLIPAGWEEVSSTELRKLGVDPRLLGEYGRSFSATLFKDLDGRYVLSFEGTDADLSRILEGGFDIGDIASDAMGTIANTTQVTRAVETALAVKRCLERNGVSTEQLTMTGHSLGGELAAAASIATGSKAVTFNAAGLSGDSIEYALGRHADEFGVRPTLPDAQKLVMAYTASGDPLTVVQDSTLLPDTFGTRTMLSTRPGSSKDYFVTGGVLGSQSQFDHGSTPLKGALDSLSSSRGQYYY